jgi:hypothetical protein
VSGVEYSGVKSVDETDAVRSPRVMGTSAVGSRYQATNGEERRLRRFITCCSEL